MINKAESLAIEELMDAIVKVRQDIKLFFLRRLKETQNQQISYEMFQVLSYLWRKDGVNQTEIAGEVQKNKASLTPLIDNLIRMNFVTRTENPQDRRNKIIALTCEGKQYREKFEPVLSGFYELIHDGIQQEEIRNTTALLLRMSNSISGKRKLSAMATSKNI